jgi:hypothetical protein
MLRPPDFMVRYAAMVRQKMVDDPQRTEIYHQDWRVPSPSNQPETFPRYQNQTCYAQPDCLDCERCRDFVSPTMDHDQMSSSAQVMIVDGAPGPSETDAVHLASVLLLGFYLG